MWIRFCATLVLLIGCAPLIDFDSDHTPHPKLCTEGVNSVALTHVKDNFYRMNWETPSKDLDGLSFDYVVTQFTSNLGNDFSWGNTIGRVKSDINEIELQVRDDLVCNGMFHFSVQAGADGASISTEQIELSPVGSDVINCADLKVDYNASEFKTTFMIVDGEPVPRSNGNYIREAGEVCTGTSSGSWL
jgi:hypothetical protein